MRKVIAALAFSATAVGLSATANAASGSATVDMFADQYGRSICAEIRKEGPAVAVPYLGNQFVGKGFTSEQAGYIIGTAVLNYCPEYASIIRQTIA